MPFISTRSQNKIPSVIAHPIHVKRYTGAKEQRAKTDKLGA